MAAATHLDKQLQQLADCMQQALLCCGSTDTADQAMLQPVQVCDGIQQLQHHCPGLQSWSTNKAEAVLPSTLNEQPTGTHQLTA